LRNTLFRKRGRGDIRKPPVAPICVTVVDSEKRTVAALQRHAHSRSKIAAALQRHAHSRSKIAAALQRHAHSCSIPCDSSFDQTQDTKQRGCVAGEEDDHHIVRVAELPELPELVCHWSLHWLHCAWRKRSGSKSTFLEAGFWKLFCTASTVVSWLEYLDSSLVTDCFRKAAAGVSARRRPARTPEDPQR